MGKMAEPREPLPVLVIGAGFAGVGVGLPPSTYGLLSSSPMWILWIMTLKSTGSASAILGTSKRETRSSFALFAL